MNIEDTDSEDDMRSEDEEDDDDLSDEEKETADNYEDDIKNWEELRNIQFWFLDIVFRCLDLRGV